MRSHVSNFGSWLGAMAFLFAPLAVQAGNASKTVNQADEAARLLHAVRSDATQVRTAAIQLDKLTETSSATWIQYDQQWNQMKPAVEDMQQKLWRLEKIRASIPAAEQQQVDQSKTAIEAIQSKTHALRVLLDQPGVQMNNAKFPADATSLKTQAGRLEQASRKS
jgi:2C-methyl-D-erythritol 2,4-cyclodiphosphate synthase